VLGGSAYSVELALLSMVCGEPRDERQWLYAFRLCHRHFEIEIECITKSKMEMKKLTISFLSTLLFVVNINIAYSQSVFDLKGQRVILAPPVLTQKYNSETGVWDYRVGEKESVYTLDALQKMDFKDNYLYPDLISGDTVIITDVKHINQDKKKKEAVLLLMNHKGNDVVYHIPLHFSTTDYRAFRAYLSNEYYIRSWSGEVNWGVKEATIDDVDVVYYNVDSLRMMEHYLKEKDLWVVLKKNTKDEDILTSSKYYPYKFLRFEIKEHKYNSRIARRELQPKTLHAIFQASDGDIREYELAHRKELPGIIYTSEKEETISGIPNMFISEDEMRKRCENMAINKMNLIDSIMQEFKDKEVYLDDQLIPDRANRLSYSITDHEMKYGSWGDGYFTFQQVKVLPIINNRPHHALYAILLDSNSKEYALAISNSFFNYVLDGDLHKNKVQKQLKQDKEKRAAEELQRRKEYQEYERSLISKYGASNAKLIMQGKIQLGFTREMVRAAWGRPYDISTITNALGTVEMWMYGIGDSYVYFQNGKVIQIIE
jgi:hypothetical protein